MFVLSENAVEGKTVSKRGAWSSQKVPDDDVKSEILKLIGNETYSSPLQSLPLKEHALMVSRNWCPIIIR